MRNSIPMHPKLRIVADINMPFVREAFGTLGDVLALDGRNITAEHVRDADILVTRSTTRVNASLLEGSRVCFYGSGVIGTDHIDISWLDRQRIAWQSAPGCNAGSVAQYIACALLWLAGRHDFTLEGKTLGVVGVGHVGRKVVDKGRALGMRVVCCDPPRQRDPSDVEARDFVDLPTLLDAADIVTLHVPLTREGEDATWHMLSMSRLARLKPGAILINAARGPVLDNEAWMRLRGSGPPAHTLLDTWEPEPAYRADVRAAVDLGTPHIAGHSFEGKVNGTLQVYKAACRFLGRPAEYRPTMPPPPVPMVEVDAAGKSDEEVMRNLALAVYDIAADDAVMRAGCVPDTTARAAAFDRQRRDYPMRREFGATLVRLRHATPTAERKIRALGFDVN